MGGGVETIIANPKKRGSIRQSLPVHLFNGSAPPPGVLQLSLPEINEIGLCAYVIDSYIYRAKIYDVHKGWSIFAYVFSNELTQKGKYPLPSGKISLNAVLANHWVYLFLDFLPISPVSSLVLASAFFSNPPREVEIFHGSSHGEKDEEGGRGRSVLGKMSA